MRACAAGKVLIMPFRRQFFCSAHPFSVLKSRIDSFLPKPHVCVKEWLFLFSVNCVFFNIKGRFSMISTIFSLSSRNPPTPYKKVSVFFCCWGDKLKKTNYIVSLFAVLSVRPLGSCVWVFLEIIVFLVHPRFSTNLIQCYALHSFLHSGRYLIIKDCWYYLFSSFSVRA